ncbi:MAG TPA: CHAP domain-containing protein [Streptosporangiaceae bacterium]|nr:CHAP domain-containing protein [Streptosporangiaceae bacterium]
MTQLSAHAAATTAERIVSIAEANVGKGPCSTNSAGGKGFYSSSNGAGGQPEAWCADFVKWVWAQAGMDVEWLTPAAGSFGEYGPVVATPQVGDAALYNYDGVGYADHVTLVVAVNANGTYLRIGGDEGNHHSFSTTTVDRDGPFKSKVGNTDSGQKLSGFVRPRRVGQSSPWVPLVVNGTFDAMTQRALQWKLKVVQDGEFGPVSMKALQRYLHVPVTGDRDPNSINALQRHIGVRQNGKWTPWTTKNLQQALNDGKF